MPVAVPPRSLTQAKHLQLLAHDVAASLRKDLEEAPDADARARIARALRDAVSAWDTARDACRVLRGRGLPKAEPERAKRRYDAERARRASSGPQEVPPEAGAGAAAEPEGPEAGPKEA